MSAGSDSLLANRLALPVRLARWKFTIILSCLLALAFLAFPMPFAAKAHHFLHGLCAQRPSHSFVLGATVLPFDARMTGIYSGFLLAFGLVASRQRLTRAAAPGLATGLVLIAFVAIMGLDGLNALMHDVGAWHLYEPANWLRLATGVTTGITLAVALSTLLAMSTWWRPDLSRSPAGSWWQPLGLLALAAPGMLLLTRGPDWYAAPVTGFLLVSAAIVFSALAFVCGLIVTGRENSFRSATDLDRFVAAAVLGGVSMILLLSGLRFGIEHLTNAPPLT